MGIDYASYGTPRADLGVAMEEYRNGADKFIGTKVFPTTPVMKQAANYPVITRESLTATADTSRAKRSNYNRTSLQTEDKAYACEEHGLEGVLDVSERAVYKSDFDAEAATSQDIMYKLMRAQEMRIAAIAMSETTFDDSDVFFHAPTIWSTLTATIVNDIETAKEKVFLNTGMEANKVVIGREILTDILKNTDVKSRIQYVQSSGVDAIMASLANTFGVDEVLVGGGVYNTKPQGATAASLSAVWGSTYCLVAVCPNDAQIVSPALGRNFLWADDSPENVMVESYVEPQTRGDVFRVRQNTDEKLIEKYFGCLIDVTATS